MGAHWPAPHGSVFVGLFGVQFFFDVRGAFYYDSSAAFGCVIGDLVAGLVGAAASQFPAFLAYASLYPGAIPCGFLFYSGAPFLGFKGALWRHWFGLDCGLASVVSSKSKRGPILWFDWARVSGILQDGAGLVYFGLARAVPAIEERLGL